MLDWLIVGGGPHGVHLANHLRHNGVDPSRLCILDPHELPLARWGYHTNNTGMTHLRSPEVHNLGIGPFELGSHAKKSQFIKDKRKGITEEEADFIPPYTRPSLRLFMHHTQAVVTKMKIMKSWHQGFAKSIEKTDLGYIVQTDTGVQLSAKNVVFALGIGDQPNWPEWAKSLQQTNDCSGIHHIFEPDFRREQVSDESDVVIVGAGISAAQLALALSEVNSKRQVTIVSRHSLRRTDFDSDPGWLGPKYLNSFNQERDYGKRRSMILEARNRGTLASEVMCGLECAIRNHNIDFEVAEIDSAVYDLQNKKVTLKTRCKTMNNVVSESELQADRIILATGFEPKRPGGMLIDDAIQNFDLRTAEDGFPIVDSFLRWREGLFVMGALAELEVGPVSRNISGARMAAERIIKSPEAHESFNLPLSPLKVETPLKAELQEASAQEMFDEMNKKLLADFEKSSFVIK